MSFAEFLDWDDGTDTRYRWIDGRVVAMAPPNPRHSAITGQLARLIGNALTPPCRVYVEAGIVTPARTDTYLQADLAVAVGRSTSRAATWRSRFSWSRWNRRAP